MASAGASAGFRGELTTHSGSVRCGSTLHSHGALGGSLGGGVGYSDGVLSIDLNFGLALGLFGAEFDLGFDLDLGVIPGATEFIEIWSDFGLGFGRFVGELGERVVCEVGVWCPTDAPSSEQASYASDQAAAMSNYPAERYRYLHQTTDWRHADPDSESYQENLEFYETFRQLRDDVEGFRQEQVAIQTEMFRLLDEDPVEAIEYARFVADEYARMDDNLSGVYYRDLWDLQSRMDSLGVGISVGTDGHALYYSTP